MKRMLGTDYLIVPDSINKSECLFIRLLSLYTLLISQSWSLTIEARK